MFNWHGIKQLIFSGQYSEAIKLLEKFPKNIFTIEALSYLYQIENSYLNEESLMNYAIKYFPFVEYFKERKAWLQTPIFNTDPTKSKVVPRTPIRLERNIKTIPSSDILKKMCFVSASDSNYFEMLWQLLESLQNTVLYKNIPFYILDLGLEKTQIDLLNSKFPNLTFKQPDLRHIPNEVPKNKHIVYQVLLSRPFLHHIIPNYKFYFWLDADTWIQDERGLDTFILQAKNYGIGVSTESAWNSLEEILKWIEKTGHNYFKAQGQNSEIICNHNPQYLNLFSNTKPINAGAHCINIDYPIFEEWWKIYKENIGCKGLSFLSDQISLNIVCAHRKIPILDHHFNEPIGIKTTYLGPKDLFYTSNNKLISIVSLQGTFKNNLYSSTVRTLPANKIIKTSCAFRTWDPKTKIIVKQKLLNLISKKTL